MTNHLYMLVFQWSKDANLPLNSKKFSDTFENLPDDWFRLNVYSWLIWTEKSSKQLTELLKEIFPGEKFVLVRVNPNDYYGWSSVNIWDWLKEKRKLSRSV